MYYLTSGLSSLTVNDSIVILAGAGLLADYLDNGRISSSSDTTRNTLSITGESRTLTLAGNRPAGQYFVALNMDAGVAAISGNWNAVNFAGQNGRLNFAADAGAMHPTGVFTDSGIAIRAANSFQGNSFDSSSVVTAVISAINATGGLTIVSDLSGIITSSNIGIHDGFSNGSNYIDGCTNGSPTSYGITVGSDLSLAASLTGSVTASATSENYSYKNFSVNGNDVKAIALQVGSGTLSIVDGMLGVLGASGSFIAVVDSTLYVTATGKEKEEMPSASAATGTGSQANIIAVSASTLSVGKAWGGLTTAELLPLTVSLYIKKNNKTDVKDDPSNPPNADVSANASDGIVNVFGIKANTINIGSISGEIIARSNNISVSAAAYGKNAVVNLNNWAVNVASISGNTMNVASDFGGKLNASSNATFTANARANLSDPAVKDEKVNTDASFNDNEIVVAGVNLSGSLSIAGSLTSEITAHGSLTVNITGSGANSGASNEMNIKSNSLTVAGILVKSLSLEGTISSNITVDGTLSITENLAGPGTLYFDDHNLLKVYGIKAEELRCSEFSGTISVSSSTAGNFGFGTQVAGIYVSSALNGGTPDEAFTITGSITVTGVSGLVAGIMRGSASSIGGLNVRVGGSIIATSSGNISGSYAYAIHVGDIYGKTQGGFTGGSQTTVITTPIDDRVELSAGASVVGDFELSTGTNYVTIDSRATMVGDIKTTGGTLNLRFNLNGPAAASAILTAKSNFASGECSISTFTLDVTDAASSQYKVLRDNAGIDGKWVGQTVSLLYQGQTYLIKVASSVTNASYFYINGTDSVGVRVYLADSGRSIVAEVDRPSPVVSVSPGLAAPTVNLNDATLMWQDMSVKYDPAAPVDPDSPIANVAWDGRQVAQYEVQYSVSNDFSHAMALYSYGDEFGYASNNIFVNGLAAGTYYWRVRAIYADGTLSSWSDDASQSATFTVVDKLLYTTPDTVDNTSMSVVDPNGAAGRYNTSTVLLDWADSAAATGIDYYTVEYFSSNSKGDYYLDFSGDAQPNTESRANILAQWLTANPGMEGTKTEAEIITEWLAANPGMSVAKTADELWDEWVAANPGALQTRVVSASELLLTGLSNYTNLHWRVKAIANDLGGNLDNVSTTSAWSYYQNQVLVWAGDKTAPTAPSKLDVNAIVNADDPSKIDMELLWNVSNDAQSGVQRYIVQYGLSQDWSDPANYTELVVSGSAAQLTPNGKITIPGLGETLNNQSYYWRVQAVDYVGNSSAWTEGKTFIIDMTAPTDPVLIDVATSGSTSLGADGITFNWKPAVDASSLTYDIQISASGDFSSDFYAAAIGVAGVADTSGNLSFTISGADFATLLTNSGYSFADGTTFHWRVKAFDHPVGASYSNESNWVSGQFAVDLTDDTAPVGPTTITLSQVPGQRSISVTWTPATDNKTPQAELRYLVSYKAAGDVIWTQRVVDTNSFTLTGGEEGKEYFFKVSAIDNASKVGAESAEASIICDATAPTNNAGLASSVTSGPNGSIVFSWNVATDAGDAAQSFNTNYELQYSTSYLFTPGAGLHTITVNSGNMVISDGRVTLTVSGADLAGFADLTTYFWRVQAVDHAGNKSAFTAGTDKFVAPDVTAPTQPANLTMVRVANQQMTRFQWDASSDNSRSVSYILSYWTNPDKSDMQSVTVTGNSKDLALAAGPVYWSVQAVDNVGNKSVATEAGGTVDYIAPYIPADRASAVNQDTRAVTLSWTPANPDDAAPGSGLAKYEIRYSNTSAYNPDDTVTVTVDGALSQFVIGTNLLKDAETYYWQIRAIDRNGNASVWNDGAGATFIAPDTTNSTGDAKPITLGQAVNERIGGPKDPADYYYLTLDNTGNYTFTVTSSATSVGITLVNLANNQTISYRSGQTVDLSAGNYRVGVTNSGTSVEYTFNSTANSIYSVNNNDDTWNNPANNSQIVMTANDSARSGEATDWVGFGDTTDYYKLVLDKAGTYTLAIDGLDNNAVMTLYIVNAAGTAISTQSGWSTTAQVYSSSSGVTITSNKLLDKLLAAGTYYVKVDRTRTTNTNYRVGVTGTAFPTDNTDDSVALVESLISTDPDDKHKLAVSAAGVISGYSDWAGFGDTTDFYSFTLTAKGTYAFELGNLTNRASLTVLQKTATGTTQKANFSVTPSSTVSGARTALLNLDEGTYFIQVSATDGNAGKNTGYSVAVSGQGALAGEDDNNANTAFVNNNPLNASEGMLSGSFSDWVGFGDVSDFRLVGLAQGAVSLTVSVDIENPATVYLYRVAELAAGPGTSLGSIAPILTFNTDGSLASIRNNILTINTGSATDTTTYKYYVEVRSTGAASGKNTDYTVITSGGSNDINATDNNMAGAQQIALDADGVAAAIHDGGIGYGDLTDYYKLVLSKDGVYGFSIDGLTGSTSTVTLRLLNSTGSQLKTVTVNLAAGESIGQLANQLLKAGTYYLNVSGPNAGFSAYDLTVDGAYNQAGGNSRATAIDLDFAVVPPSGGGAARMAAPVDLSTVVTMGGSADGWVGAGDTVDFYRFSVASDGNYNFAFRGIDNAAVLTIYAKSFNSLGQEIASTALGQLNSRGNIADLSLLLTSGDYYVEVSSANASNPVNTNYYIDATATTFATLQVNGLNAIDFDAAGSTTYRFDLAMDGDISLSIDGDAALVRYSLYHKVGNELVEIKSSNRAGDLNVKDLDAGSYFVKINYAGAGAANFELALDLPDQVPPAAGSLSLDAAVDDGQSAGLQLAGVDGSELSFGLNLSDSLLAAGSDLSIEAEKQNALKLGLLA